MRVIVQPIQYAPCAWMCTPRLYQLYAWQSEGAPMLYLNPIHPGDHGLSRSLRIRHNVSSRSTALPRTYQHNQSLVISRKTWRTIEVPESVLLASSTASSRLMSRKSVQSAASFPKERKDLLHISILDKQHSLGLCLLPASLHSLLHMSLLHLQSVLPGTFAHIKVNLPPPFNEWN
jgi:hypothetical protein